MDATKLAHRPVGAVGGGDWPGHTVVLFGGTAGTDLGTPGPGTERPGRSGTCPGSSPRSGAVMVAY